MVRLSLDIFYLQTKFGVVYLSRYGNMIVGVEIENGARDPDHAPFMGGYYPSTYV